MCFKGGWLVFLALLLGLIQSVVWIILTVVSALVYLCVIPVPPYKDSSDFLLVTVVKLYFEGPECKPDGSYLGQFNEDYRNPEVLRLFTPDKVFAIVVALFILNVLYFILSLRCWTERGQQKSVEAAQCENQLLMLWSVVTLVICAVDVIFCMKLVMDVISLKDYMGDPSQDVFFSSARGNLAEVPYIPLLLALISSRFIAVWLWNLVIGLVFFFNTLCCKSLVKTPAKIDTTYEGKHRVQVMEKAAVTAERSTSMTSAKESYDNNQDFRSQPNLTESKSSMEALTTFSSPVPKTMYTTESGQDWSYWTSPKPNTSTEFWEMTNEGYVDDEKAVVVEQESERTPDFDHDLKNFEQGQRKIRIVKPPLGKPVEKMRE